MFERHRAEVAHLDDLHVGTLFDDLAEDLVAEHEVGRRGRAAPDHVLVAAADVGGHDLENDAVVELATDIGRVDAGTVAQFELRVVGLVHLDLARLDVRDASVACHRKPPAL